MHRRYILLLFAVVVVGITSLTLAQTQPELSSGDYGDAPDGQDAGYVHVMPGLIAQFPSLRSLEQDYSSFIYHAENELSPLLGTGITNEPNARVSNLDEDDGWQIESFETCSFATIRMEVTIPADAPQGEVYLNALFDWNHDGRWRGFSVCESSLGPRTTSEWELRNIPLHQEPYNVTPGFSGIVELPTILSGPYGGEFWVRFTLTNKLIDESVFVSSAFGGEGWDGRGSFDSGETEDYLSCLLFNRDTIFGGCPARATQQPPLGDLEIFGSSPIAGDDTAVASANGSVRIDVLANDSDPDSDKLSVQSVTNPMHGRLEILPNGSIIYFPNANFTGVDEFTYLVCDPFRLCAVGVVTVSVQRGNQPPIVVNDIVMTIEEHSVIVNPLENDKDPDGDPLVITEIDQPANGMAVLNPDGTITYTPDREFSGTDSIVYVVCDTNNSCSVGLIVVTVTITVRTNQPPVAVDDSAVTSEETSVIIDVLANDSDADDGISRDSLVILDAPLFGDVFINPLTQSIIYTPRVDFNGEDSFSYQICDLQLACSTAQVTVTITPVNDAPTAVSLLSTVFEDSSLDIVLSCLDNESDPLSYAIISGPANGTLSGSPPDLTYAPNPNFNGSDTITYACNDGTATGNTATVTIAVLPVNDPPTAQINGPYSCLQGEVAQLSSAGSFDPDGQVVKYAWDLNDNASFETMLENPTYSCSTPGVYRLSLIVFDNDGGTSFAETTLTVTALDVNSPPVALTTLGTTLQNQPLGGVLNVSDPDHDALTCSLSGNAQHGTIIVNSDCTYTYTPSADYVGADQFTFTVSDGSATTTGTVLLQVNAQPAQLSISKSVLGSSALFEGDTATFQLTVQNTGLGDAFGVSVVDLLPSSLVFVSSSDPSYNSGSGVWNIGNLPRGTSRSLTITATVNSNVYPNSITNTASIASCSNAGQSSCTLAPGTAFATITVSGFCGKSASWSMNWDPSGNRNFSGNTIQITFDMSNSGQGFIRDGLATITCLSGDCGKIQSVSVAKINAPSNVTFTTSPSGTLVNFNVGVQPSFQNMIYLVTITLDPSWQEVRLRGTIINNSCKPVDNGQKTDSGTLKKS